MHQHNSGAMMRTDQAGQGGGRETCQETSLRIQGRDGGGLAVGVVSGLSEKGGLLGMGRGESEGDPKALDLSTGGRAAGEASGGAGVG